MSPINGYSSHDVLMSSRWGRKFHDAMQQTLSFNDILNLIIHSCNGNVSTHYYPGLPTSLPPLFIVVYDRSNSVDGGTVVVED